MWATCGVVRSRGGVLVVVPPAFVLPSSSLTWCPRLYRLQIDHTYWRLSKYGLSSTYDNGLFSCVCDHGTESSEVAAIFGAYANPNFSRNRSLMLRNKINSAMHRETRGQSWIRVSFYHGQRWTFFFVLILGCLRKQNQQRIERDDVRRHVFLVIKCRTMARYCWHSYGGHVCNCLLVYDLTW